jgi:CRP-like cAMP-binding protein
MAHRHLPHDEQEKRDLRIVKLADLGVLHADIARAVGLSNEYISTLLNRRRRENKTSCQVGVDRGRGLWRRSSLDGIY